METSPPITGEGEGVAAVAVGGMEETKKEEVKGEGRRRSKSGRDSSYFPRVGCFSSSATDVTITTATATINGSNGKKDPPLERGHAAESGGNGKDPTHLVIMVNGIIGSAGNWRFAAKQLVKRYPDGVVVLRSRSNCNSLTFHGVDVMGERLAKEVLSVVECYPELKKISFVAHSLGGLIARYAIARLYKHQPKETSEENGNLKDSDPGKECLEEKSEGKIAGLEPMNFITFATPHLGSRWHKQMPFLCGFHALEKLAPRISSVLGRTGINLCLKDSDDGKPPLLLQMANDTGDLKFISALRSFKRRVVYSNTCSDHMVGWKTSSIRRQHELPKRQQFTKNSKYPHVVHVETANSVTLDQEVLPKERVEVADMEEEMIKGLNRVAWERVDVSFHKSIQRIMAHSTIQVKTYYINSHGADVINHMIDNFIL